MDPEKDPPAVKNENDDDTENDVAGASSVRRLRDKVTYYEKVWQTGTKRPLDLDEPDGVGIDVQAFEQRLQEERKRKTHENSPKIEVRLRSTPQSSPRHFTSTHHGNSPDDESYEESIERTTESGQINENSRVFKFEKITLKKSVREVCVTSPPQSPSSPLTTFKTFVRTEKSLSRTPSEERHFHDDSAYHTQSHAISIASKSSSITSLPGAERFSSEENISRQQTPSREKMFDSWSTLEGGGSDGGASIVTIRTGNVIHGTSGGAGAVVSVSTVAAGNQLHRLQKNSDRHTSSGECEGDTASQEWYNDYRTHSLQSPVARMNIQRTNSQYDSHIKQIKG